MTMLVSVIIPVYEAERFVRQAVESALEQPETCEVLLIEDASRDRSLQVCEQLAGDYPLVRLLRHADGKNHGAGASRNLGIANARFDHVAFLDADDYFLPGRFTVAKALFDDDPALDGVYEAVGSHFEDRESERRWLAEPSHAVLTTMTERVAPEDLFERQSPLGFGGYCATGGWVVRRSIFARAGVFDEHLRLHQDTVMYVRFAAVGRMMPGRLEEPVAMRRVHASNRSSAPRLPWKNYRDYVRMWVALWRWGRVNLPRDRERLLTRRFMEYASRPPRTRQSRIGRLLFPQVQMALLGLVYPGLLLEPPFWSSCLRVTLPFRIADKVRRDAAARVARHRMNRGEVEGEEEAKVKVEVKTEG